MRLLAGLVALALAALVVFALWPQIDVEAARAFYGESGFLRSAPARAGRAFFSIAPFVTLAALAALYALRKLGLGRLWAPSGRQLGFLVATMAIGPGLIVNLGLKDHTHRPRPIQTRDFGGPFAFRPWDRLDGQCPRNCSFVSGEGAAAFWMVAPASLAPPPWRAPAIAAALGFGVATSALRMAFGGHYLSDVVLAALLTLILVQGARLLLFARRRAS
ncbi:MAG: phosphatase PAP2 family protein [Roseiarcus sp.]|jgi:membrane-associated phospholipid phosphatase